MGVLFKSFYRWDGVAVFNATSVGAKETGPFLNVTLAKILSVAQFTQLCADSICGRLHRPGSVRKVRDKPSPGKRGELLLCERYGVSGGGIVCDCR